MELFLLFFLLPIVLAAPLLKAVKIAIVAVGIIYVGVVLFHNRKDIFKKVPLENTNSFWKRVTSINIIILILGIVIVQLWHPEYLFKVPINQPLLWLTILFVYSFFSVIPQEIVYRKFFFWRYESLFKNKKLFLFLNVICFSLCHLFFKNIWVILVTLAGGLFFTYTYHKTGNLKLVSIEHALYGNLVFTVGLGNMLAFPG